MILKAAFTIIALLGVLLYKWTNLPGDLNGILTDEKQNGHLVLLDAKAAFDKVIHSHLFRRMYHAGIQDKTWTIIKSLHHNAESCIKWVESTSDCFKVGMAARQGGILRERPFNLILIPSVAEKNILILVEEKTKSDSEFLSYNLMLNSGKKIALCATKKK